MPSHYVISKRRDGWAITVDGAVLLVCERKKTALRAVRDAMARNATPAARPAQIAAPSGEQTPTAAPDLTELL